jgi:hypothetical protein
MNGQLIKYIIDCPEMNYAAIRNLYSIFDFEFMLDL